jgi:hypothetical protein
MGLRALVVAVLASSALTGCGSSPASEPAPASAPVVIEWSAWSQTVNGVRCRARIPGPVTQGDVLAVTLELDVNPDELPEGRHILDPDLRRRRFALALVAGDESAAEVRPYDPYSGMPPDPPTEEYDPTSDLLNEAARTFTVEFPLASQWDWISPGAHLASVQLSFESSDGSTWTGAVQSGPFEVVVAAAPPREEVLLLPTRLRFEDGRVVYHPADAEEVRLPTRNGFFVGSKIEAEGGGEAIRVPPRPDDFNPIDIEPEPGAGVAPSYTITIYETADAPSHLIVPNRGTGSYRELWKRTLVPSR